MPGPEIVSDFIAITGHRVYGDPGALYRGLDNLKASEYIFGGARGIDTDALNYMAETQPHVRRTVIVPNTVAAQPIEARHAIRLRAHNVIEMRNTGANRYQLRNEAMVRRSTHLRAFYDHRGSGGTFNTIEYAKRTGKPYSITTVHSVDVNRDMGLSFEKFRERQRVLTQHNVSVSSRKGTTVAYMKDLTPEQRSILIADLREYETTA